MNDRARLDLSGLNLSDQDFDRLLSDDVLGLLDGPADAAAPAGHAEARMPAPTAAPYAPAGMRAGYPVAHPALAATFVDPSEMEFTPQPRPKSTITSRGTSLIVRGLVLAFLCWLIVPEINFRFTHKGQVRFQNGVLTAQPVRLSSLSATRVLRVNVDPIDVPDEDIPAGTAVADIEEPSIDGVRSRELSVPFDSRLVSVDSPTGSIVRPGDPIVTVYDPKKLVVIITVSSDDLTRLRRGMRAEAVNRDAKQIIHGTVDSAVPVLGTDHDPATKRLVNVRIVPDADSAVDLLPGMRFQVFVDLRTGTDEPIFIPG